MTKYKYTKGFSLTEILVATIVMSMIMGSVLAFVQYAGSIWHKGNEKISTQNYSRVTFELLKQDLLLAQNVSYPKQWGKYRKKLRYQTNDLTSTHTVELTNDNTLIKYTIQSGSTSSTTLRLARNVKAFYVNRISSRTFEISLQINGQEYENNEGIIASDTISSESMVLIAPGVN
jgi:prepilin-type N-terminal cleavage/methylation domain-containing protein